MASSVILHTTPLAQERRPSGAASLPRSLFWDIARPSKLWHPAWGSTRRRFSCSAMSGPCRGFLCGGVTMLKEVYPNCAGLDVHKKFVTAYRLTVDAQGTTHAERRKCSTMTGDLAVCRALHPWGDGEHGRLLATHLQHPRRSLRAVRGQCPGDQTHAWTQDGYDGCGVDRHPHAAWFAATQLYPRPPPVRIAGALPLSPAPAPGAHPLCQSPPKGAGRHHHPVECGGQ